jgi:hypothetical protein
MTDTHVLYDSIGPLSIGGFSDGSSPSTALSGYMDEFRLTKGVARYTASFVKPVAPAPIA